MKRASAKSDGGGGFEMIDLVFDRKCAHVLSSFERTGFLWFFETGVRSLGRFGPVAQLVRAHA